MRSAFVGLATALLAAATPSGSVAAQSSAADQSPSSPPDTAVHLRFGAFVDGYYAYDFNRPPEIDRSYTTQPARHNEFNINLAFVDATLVGARVRGRLALQYGTSMQANYAAEPRHGTISGPDVSRFLQEATAGYRIASSLWLDAGIFFSHIGNEGWISRDQWTYTRSLIADYTPYYEAGVRATWMPSSRLVATVVVVNGWQNISETNSGKGGGVRLDYAVTPQLVLSYDDYLGNEQPDSLPSRLRIFHEVIAKYAPSDRAGIVATFDYGTQQRPEGGHSTWTGGAVIARYGVASRVIVNGRLEYYDDPDQVIVVSPAPEGFRTVGASIGVDVAPAPRLLWRAELRALHARDPVFPEHGPAGSFSESDAVAVTSIGLTF
jgi:hypothetical protein